METSCTAAAREAGHTRKSASGEFSPAVWHKDTTSGPHPETGEDWLRQATLRPVHAVFFDDFGPYDAKTYLLFRQQATSYHGHVDVRRVGYER